MLRTAATSAAKHSTIYIYIYIYTYIYIHIRNHTQNTFVEGISVSDRSTCLLGRYSLKPFMDPTWTHLSLVAHTCILVGNGLSPVGCQAITWTNADWMSIGPSVTNCSETGIKIQDFTFMKMRLKISSAKWRPFCPGGEELIPAILRT